DVKVWKFFLGALLLFGALWLLNPERGIKRDERGVVEIGYLAESGPEAASVEDAMREFETQSRIAHEKDPTHPIYKIVTGQTASRDQTADPTRFLVSVAGGMPPDLILFDRYAVSEWAARGAFTKLDNFVARESTNPAADAIRPQNFYKSVWGDNGRSSTLNSPAVVPALEWMTRVYDSLGGAQREFAFEGTAQSGQRNAPPGELDLFVQGKVAMKIDGYWIFPQVLAQYGQNLN